MLELKNPKIAVPVVLCAGILWSFGPLVVRYMDSPNQVPWQYIFGRGITIFVILNLYLYFEEGTKFLEKLFKNWKIRNYWGLWSWYCDDFFYLFNYKYYSCCHFTVFGCNAIFYCIIGFYFFKGTNFY